MESKKCLFSREIFKSNILRFMPFAAPLLIAEIIIFPIYIYNNFSTAKDNRLTLDDFSGISAASDIATFVFAAIMAMLVFSFLFNSSKCNATHAFPIGRKGLFITNFLSAYTLLVVPKLIGFGIGLPFIILYGVKIAPMIALHLISIFAVSFITLSIAFLAVMLTGNYFSSAVLYLIINFVYAAGFNIVSLSREQFGYGLSYLWDYYTYLEYYPSPIVQLVSTKFGIGYVYIDYSLRDYYTTLAIITAVSAVILFISYVLYKKRQLECAGDMLSYKKLLPILSVLVSLFGGAYATFLFTSIFDFEVYGSIAVYVITSLICYFAAQMILRKNARVFQAKHFIIWAVCAAAGLAAIAGIVTYSTNYLPKADKVKSVTLNVSYYMELTSKEEIEKAIKLHSMLIETKNDPSIREYDYSNTYDELSFSFNYELKNKNTVDRTYYIREDKCKEYFEILDELEAAHCPETVFDNLEGFKFKINSCKISSNYEERADGTKPEDFKILLEGKEAEEFYKLYKNDMASLAKTYRTSKKDVDMDYDDSWYTVSFDCTLTDKAVYSKLRDLEYSGDVFGSYIYLYDSYEFEVEKPTNGKYDFDINLGSVNYKTKSVEFINAHK